MPLFLQILAQKFIIFNDSVMYDSDMHVAACVRMSIQLRYAAVRCPTCMRNGSRTFLMEAGSIHVANFPRILFDDNKIPLSLSDPPRVISPVFQVFNSVDDNGTRICSFPYISKNPTHIANIVLLGQYGSIWLFLDQMSDFLLSFPQCPK